MELEISLFRFDKDSDYLPYYTKHFLELKDEKNLLDILRAIYRVKKFSFFDSQSTIFVVNNIFMEASTSLEKIINRFGKDLRIEPISIKRVFKDFLINEDDFHSKFKILEKFCNFEDKEFYLKQKIFYYASNSLNFKDNYIGDALLLLASNLITKNPNLKDEILKVLKEQKYGASFHTNLENRIFNFDLNIEKNIKELQKKLGVIKENSFKTINFEDIKIDLNIKHNFNNFNIACFNKDSKFNNFLEKLEANFLNLENLDLNLQLDTFAENPKLTYFVASQILLSAFDGGADFLLVFNSEDFFIFNNKLKEIEKISNREIPLPIIHINELIYLSSDNFEEAKKSFKNHKINPKII
ncbi:DUF5644 domain-containing protein [Arcobacter vandammei]|uniref:HdrB C-terminal domain-containing protein n=1 Tax=Arcobacter vandammei TaxID=2782243 RepID=UPI0018E00CCC|nr:DUF5644 domain-containing protein [Arcobacter vandammei]